MKHIEKEIANFFEVSERAFEKWKKKWPELVQAIARGKDIADEEVVVALRDQAVGFPSREPRRGESGPLPKQCGRWLSNHLFYRKRGNTTTDHGNVRRMGSGLFLL